MNHFSRENTDELFTNLEILTTMVLAAGMISIIISELVGTIVIIFGIVTLIFVYIARLLFPDISGTPDIPVKNRTANYAACITALVGALLLIVQFEPEKLFFIVSISILGVIFIINILNRKSFAIRVFIAIQQVRVVILAILLVIFYFLT